MSTEGKKTMEPIERNDSVFLILASVGIRVLNSDE